MESLSKEQLNTLRILSKNDILRSSLPTPEEIGRYENLVQLGHAEPKVMNYNPQTGSGITAVSYAITAKGRDALSWNEDELAKSKSSKRWDIINSVVAILALALSIILAVREFF